VAQDHPIRFQKGENEMKQYTHAWIAFMAVKRLKKAIPNLSAANKPHVKSLVRWIMHYEDDIIQGAWYPDAIIKDMANSHVLKLTPSTQATNQFDTLPTTHMVYQETSNSPLSNSSFEYADPNDNLPDRCESIAHSIVDNLKMQKSEVKGSPVPPTNNHIALRFFMLSHYIADAHMPLHCDSRRFSSGSNIHAKIEGRWDDLIRSHYEIDTSQDRFFYDSAGFPLRDMTNDAQYQTCYLKDVEDEIINRSFRIGYGTDRDRTWDFMRAICQHSYLMAYLFIPSQYDHNNIPADNWDGLGTISFDDMSVAVLSDAIESIAHVWFRIWRRYREWAS
jgi:hypothetical protein